MRGAGGGGGAVQHFLEFLSPYSRNSGDNSNSDTFKHPLIRIEFCDKLDSEVLNCMLFYNFLSRHVLNV